MEEDEVYILVHKNCWAEGESGDLLSYRNDCSCKNSKKHGITILISDRLIENRDSDRRVTKGIWTSIPLKSDKSSNENHKDKEYILCLDTSKKSIELYKAHEGEYYKIKRVHIIHFETNFLERIRGIFDVELISDKVVALVGVGSMGSSIALELAKSGIQKFILIDPDILEVHNICRHMCGISDIGRPKVDAVRDLILDKNPRATVDAIKDSFTIFNENLCSKLLSSDIVIVTTDVDLAKRDVNYFCVKNKILAIYAGVFERAFGGEVVRYIPDVTPCYNCILGHVRMLEEEIPSGNVLVDYSAIDDPNKVVAEPGLSIDFGFVSLIATKICLETLKGKWLLKGDDDTEPPDLIFWGNKKDWIFNGPFDYVRAKSELGPRSCEVCDPQYFNKKLNMSDDEIHKEVNEKIGQLLLKIKEYKGGAVDK